MAGSKTDIWEVDVLKMVTGQATTLLTTTPLTNVYLALFTVAPTDAGGGTEVSGGSYARVDSKGKWAVPASGSVSTNAVVTFPTATADWAAGATQIVAFAIMTAITAGNMLMYGTLTTAKNVLNGDTPSFASGALTLTED